MNQQLTRKEKENQKLFKVYLTALILGVFICTVIEYMA